LQKKIQITGHGVATIYHKDALQFVLRWKESMRVHEGWIQSIEHVAACCPLWPRHMLEQDFGGSYLQAPNLAAALLHELRKKWGRLEKSKAGKLKKFFSQQPCVKWDDDFNSPAAVREAEAITKSLKEKEPKIPLVGGSRAVTQADYEHLALCRTLWAKRRHSGPVPDTLGNVSISDLPEKHIKSAVEKLPWGKGVTIDDIMKARKWVVANQRAGKKFAEKVLGKDKFLHVKGKAQRRR
jgi:hypothetical protein